MGVLVIRSTTGDYITPGYLDSANPTTPSTGTETFSGNDKSGSYKGIIEWDLRGLKHIRAVAAGLELKVTSAAGGGSGTDRVRRMRRHSGSATPFVSAQCCWNEYSSGNAWAAAGATDTTNDVDTTNSFSWTCATSGFVTCIAPTNGNALSQLVNDALVNQGGYLALLFELASRSGNLKIGYRNGNGTVWDADNPKLTLIYENTMPVQLWTPGAAVVV